MEQRRTDLALEAAQLWREGGNTGELPGVTQEESTREGYPVTTVKVLDDRGAKAIGKPVGTYVTVDLSALVRREEDAFGRGVTADEVVREARRVADGYVRRHAGVGRLWRRIPAPAYAAAGALCATVCWCAALVLA